MRTTCKGNTVNKHKTILLFNVQPLTNMWVELLSLTRVFLHTLTKKKTKKNAKQQKKKQKQNKKPNKGKKKLKIKEKS